ncbi:hypothetical protein BG015_009113 [Linnemannia schmuckeri]|uniref:Uncharacterized protein n=1 Tax=Linnemannia schmuckeri TaxID=64567 RepID=A0A9P5RYP0_9FUNG|nr:hypothetical protein BG015_009113 [Linnemannia schmuckeri]
MTLISSSVPLDTFYCHNNTLTHQNNTSSTAPEQALSWLHFESATVSTPTIKNNKYRTLASIQAQSLQQHLHLLNNSDSLSPVSPTSTKPSILDTQSTSTSTTTTTTTTTSITKESTITHSITAALQAMDASHGTCFLTWIHNPTNLDYISLRLRPLCLEYPLVDVANVLRWIGADWSSADCKALFRAVTSNWDQSKRRILAFLLIRDEEMRQKAKSKLVEFAQKSSITSRKSTQLRTPGSSSSISPQQQHHRIQQPTIHYQQRIQQQQQRKQVQKVQSVTVGASATSLPSIINNNNNNNSASSSWRGGVNMTALENIAAASLITGIDMTLPLSTSFLLSSSSSTAASGSATAAACASTSTNLYSRRFSPY